jgi:predicted dehydrogenase
MPMKLAMLGMWHSHANGLVRQVAAHPDAFSLVGFHDPNPKVVADRTEQWSPLIPNFRVYDRPEELLALPLDGVVVDGQVDENVRMARLALKRGFPVMLEKPAGHDLEEHRRLIELAQHKHLHLQMIYLFRYMSAVLEMIKLARSGALGEIYLFRARLPKDLDLYDHHVEVFGRYTGGIFFEMAGHIIDMMVALLGRPESVTPFMAHHHRKTGSFIDNGVAMFGFQHAWGMIEVSALEVAPDARRIEVYGTKGACVIPHLGSGHLANDAIQPIDVFREGDDGWQRRDLPKATLHIADLREFAACVAGRKKPDYGIEHDRIVQEALLRACGAV